MGVCRYLICRVVHESAWVRVRGAAHAAGRVNCDASVSPLQSTVSSCQAVTSRDADPTVHVCCAVYYNSVHYETVQICFYLTSINLTALRRCRRAEDAQDDKDQEPKLRGTVTPGMATLAQKSRYSLHGGKT